MDIFIFIIIIINESQRKTKLKTNLYQLCLHDLKQSLIRHSDLKLEKALRVSQKRRTNTEEKERNGPFITPIFPYGGVD